jgi:hypothetical protein
MNLSFLFPNRHGKEHLRVIGVNAELDKQWCGNKAKKSVCYDEDQKPE